MVSCLNFDTHLDCILIVFLPWFQLCGAAILGIGIWFLADKDISSKIEIVQINSGDEYFKYAAYLFIAFGAFVFIIGFAGMCGAIRSSKCLLGFVSILYIQYWGWKRHLPARSGRVKIV